MSKIAFRWKICITMLVGYLLATLPPIVLDPRLPSHVAFPGGRHYERAYYIVPIALGVVSGTWLWMGNSRIRYVAITLLFVAACILSIPIFRPEVPHGNLIFVGTAWSLLSMLTLWIHTREIRDPSERTPLPASNARIDFIKEETAIWKGVSLGLGTGYLAIVMTLTLAFHTANREIVTSPRDIFILNQYSNFLLAFMSLFMFLGPIYESITKMIESNQRLLSVLPESKPPDML
ncbi:MAG TPA: hypothetical protein VGK01_15405 [Candidatus Angelobacter sp.]